MSATMIVIDTSYLLELFQVPTFSTEKSIEKVTKKFGDAFDNNYLLFIPSPCLFELGNHIAHVKDNGEKRILKQKFYNTILQAIESTGPFVILYIPDVGIEGRFREICDSYANKYTNHNVGMTDVCTILEAHRLKKKHHGLDYKVHIWTKDRTLKAYEPDPEDNPFLG